MIMPDISPPNLTTIKRGALAELSPLVPAAPEETPRLSDLSRLTLSHTETDLPEHHLVYMLLVDLLEFYDHGRAENTLWSIPIKLRNTIFVLEFGKSGFRWFTNGGRTSETHAMVSEIVKCITLAVAKSSDYFQWQADVAAKGSNLTIENRSIQLYDRYLYFYHLYESKCESILEKQTKVAGTRLEQIEDLFGLQLLKQEASWIAQSAIEAFFGWTEHVFVQLAIFTSENMTGNRVVDLAHSNWQKKYERVFDMNDSTSKFHYLNLCEIRNSLRNPFAHGLIRKDFSGICFHSRIGAIPLNSRSHAAISSWWFSANVGASEKESLSKIADFIDHLWNEDRKLLEIYIQERGLPLVLTMTCDGTYSRALESEESMLDLVEGLTNHMDQVDNMDF